MTHCYPVSILPCVPHILFHMLHQHSSIFLNVSPCSSRTTQVLELQPTGKKAMSASAFVNGLKGRKLYI